jgi:hypothetical protein
MDFFRQNIIPAEVLVQLAAFLIVFFHAQGDGMEADS